MAQYPEPKVIYCDMPATIKSYVVNKDGYYTIVINSKLSWWGQQHAFAHELAHILNRDFEKKCDVDLIEIFAHKEG